MNLTVPSTLRLLLLGCLILATLCDDVNAQVDLLSCPDLIRVHAPWRVRPEASTKIEITLGPIAAGRPVTVNLDTDDSYVLDRYHIIVTKDKPEEINLTMSRSPLGLARLSISTPGCRPFDQPIDAGFADIAVISIDNPSLSIRRDDGAAPPSVLEGGTQQFFHLHFTDRLGRPWRPEVPLTVELRAEGDATLSKNHKDWDVFQVVQIKEGVDESDPIILKTSSSVVQGEGAIDITVKMDPVHELGKYTLRYASHCAWWVFLVATIAGSLLYSAIDTLISSRKDFPAFLRIFFGEWGSKLFVALVVGAVGYLFIGSDWLGLKLDSPTIKGYIIFGVLFACLGLEGIFKRINKLLEEAQKRPAQADQEKKPPPEGAQFDPHH